MINTNILIKLILTYPHIQIYHLDYIDKIVGHLQITHSQYLLSCSYSINSLFCLYAPPIK